MDNNDQANISNQSLIHRERVRRQERRNAITEHRGSVFNQENKQSEGALLCSAGRAWMSSVMEKTSYSVCVSASASQFLPFYCACRVYGFYQWSCSVFCHYWLQFKINMSVLAGGASPSSVCPRLASSDISSASFFCLTFHFSLLLCFTRQCWGEQMEDLRTWGDAGLDQRQGVFWI